MWSGTKDVTEFALAVVVALAVLWIAVITVPEVVGLLIVTATSCGLLALAKAARGQARVRPSVAFALTAVTANVSWTLLLIVQAPMTAAVVAFVGAELAMRAAQTGGVEATEPWWSHNRMAYALVTAGVLKMVKGPDGAADRLPSLGFLGKRRGKPVDDAVGTWISLRLPPGSTWRHVVKRHSELASAMGVADPDLLHVEAMPGHADGVRIAVLRQRGDVADAPELPERTVFGDGVPLGLDRLGRRISMRVTDVHTALVAKTRAGKTWLARWFALHALLDPQAPVWMISGKDDAEDWQAMRGCCVLYATTPRQALELLRAVEREAERRGGIPKADRYPGLVMVDEWYRLRARARTEDPELAKELERLLPALAATIGSRNLHLAMTFQRGVVTYIDGDLRASLGQKLIGLTVLTKEIGYVLEDADVQVRPKRQGEFLLSDEDSVPTLFHGPKMDDALWEAACARAFELRRAEPLQLPGQRAGSDETPAETPAEVEREAEVLHLVLADPFGDAIRAQLTGGPRTGQQLHDGLPEQLRSTTSAVTGRRIGQLPGVAKTKIGERRNIAAWELTAPPGSAPGRATGTAGTRPLQGDVSGPVHAHHGPHSELPTAVGGMP